jgi:transcriptional regulator
VKDARTELLRGTLDLLVLRTLELEPRHGVAVADRIAQLTGGAFVIPAGSLFPALHRLDHQGFIRGRWSVEDGRRVKTYAITTAGRRQLAAEKEYWARIVAGIGQVLNGA